jgi:polyamine oxidase
MTSSSRTSTTGFSTLSDAWISQKCMPILDTNLIHVQSILSWLLLCVLRCCLVSVVKVLTFQARSIPYFLPVERSMFLQTTVLLVALFHHLADAQNPDVPCPTKHDVIIVGAGFAGLSAAKTLKDAGLLDFVILESSDRVGGRVVSHKGFGSKGMTVEEGANWVFPGHPIFELVQKYKLNMTRQDFFNYDMYEYDETKPVSLFARHVVPPRLALCHASCFLMHRFLQIDSPAYQIPTHKVKKRLQNFRRDALQCMTRASNKYFKPNGDLRPPKYMPSIQYLKEVCDFTLSDSQDFFNHWIYIQFEYAGDDTSVSEVVDPYFDKQYMVVDQGGFDQIATYFTEDNGLNEKIRFGRNVTKINYDEDDDVYKARVITGPKGDGDCNVHLAKRVILTVPAGVLNNNLIEFVPELRYSESEFNPFKVGFYIKIFYEFKTNFWGSTLNDKEFLVSLQQRDNVGQCHHWQNLEAVSDLTPDYGNNTDYVPGSNTIFCTLIGTSFQALLDETGLDEISEEQLTGKLLDPLRRVFGAAVVDDNLMIDSIYYPKQNLDANHGLGSYANWAPEKSTGGGYYSLDDYFKFYGVGPVGYCEHNGCNKVDPYDPDAEWILHISGTCSCYAYWEFVHGAYWGGVRSANLVLYELKHIDEVPKSECDATFLAPQLSMTTS